MLWKFLAGLAEPRKSLIRKSLRQSLVPNLEVEMNEGLANRKSLRISRRPSRLSIPALIQPVRNVENGTFFIVSQKFFFLRKST